MPLVHPALTRDGRPRQLPGRGRRRLGPAHGAHPAPGRRPAARGCGTGRTWRSTSTTAGMSVERWFPTGPTTCRLVLDYWFADTTAMRWRATGSPSSGSTTLCLEDQAICEAVQRNLEAGVYVSGLLLAPTRGRRRRVPRPGQDRPQPPRAAGGCHTRRVTSIGVCGRFVSSSPPDEIAAVLLGRRVPRAGHRAELERGADRRRCTWCSTTAGCAGWPPAAGAWCRSGPRTSRSATG